MTTPTLLLVHGAWHGAWCWDRLIAELPDLDVRTVELPSAGDDPTSLGDMLADAAVVRAAIEQVDGPVVVCAHSYGGIPTTEAAVGLSNVTRIVYLTSFQIDVGESLASTLGFEVPDWQVVHGEEGYVDTVRPEEIFYADVEEPDRSAAIARLRHHALAAFGQPLTQVAWRTVASTYVVCTQDRAIPLVAQEAMAQRATSVRRMDSSHSPFLSRPAELAELLRAELG